MDSENLPKSALDTSRTTCSLSPSAASLAILDPALAQATLQRLIDKMGADTGRPKRMRRGAYLLESRFEVSQT
jgi:hypothetical protein